MGNLVLLKRITRFSSDIKLTFEHIVFFIVSTKTITLLFMFLVLFYLNLLLFIIHICDYMFFVCIDLCLSEIGSNAFEISSKMNFSRCCASYAHLRLIKFYYRVKERDEMCKKQINCIFHHISIAFGAFSVCVCVCFIFGKKSFI